MHLNLTESCAEAGIYATSEAERAYWLSREKSYLTASVEIDVHAFHDALGLMYPMNWRSSQNGECETFMRRYRRLRKYQLPEFGPLCNQLLQQGEVHEDI